MYYTDREVKEILEQVYAEAYDQGIDDTLDYIDENYELEDDFDLENEYRSFMEMDEKTKDELRSDPMVRSYLKKHSHLTDSDKAYARRRIASASRRFNTKEAEKHKIRADVDSKTGYKTQRDEDLNKSYQKSRAAYRMADAENRYKEKTRKLIQQGL